MRPIVFDPAFLFSVTADRLSYCLCLDHEYIVVAYDNVIDVAILIGDIVKNERSFACEKIKLLASIRLAIGTNAIVEGFPKIDIKLARQLAKTATTDNRCNDKKGQTYVYHKREVQHGSDNRKHCRVITQYVSVQINQLLFRRFPRQPEAVFHKRRVSVPATHCQDGKHHCTQRNHKQNECNYMTPVLHT